MASAFADLLICLRFFSRLPLPATRREAELGGGGLAHAAAMVPLAGALIGTLPALVLAAGHLAGLPAVTAGLLALTALLVATGALHEDGLADCADGFGGGRGRERKLAIMGDSRIGTYGACALALSLALRATSLAILTGHGLADAAAILIAAAGVSRTLCLLPLVLLPSARGDGLGAMVGVIGGGRFGAACALALLPAGLPLAAGATLPHVLTAVGAACVAALCAVALARREIGGHTGDVAGATQQVSEVAMLVAFTAGL